jgi:HEPN domain-containing protein
MSIELAKEWLKASEDDLMTIEEIQDNPNLTNIIAFHSQQCVEKAFKGLLEFFNKDIPKIHSTVKLYDMVRDYIDLPVDLDIFTDLDDLYINGRYPSGLGIMSSGKPSIVDAKRFYEFAQEIYLKIKEFIFRMSPE